MRKLSALRYFAAVMPPAPPLAAVLAALAAAAVLEFLDAGSSDWVLASIALIQLFACSTGFTGAATRGYYDPVLLGRSRFAAALAHLVVSAAPGVLAWIAAGMAEAAAARSLAVPAFRPAGAAALLLVSAVPWAASVRTGPYLGGAVWTVISVSLLASGPMLRRLLLFRADPAWAGDHRLDAFSLGLAFPVLIPSLRWPHLLLLGFAAAAGVAAAVGVLAVSRADFGLAEEGS